MFIIVNHYIKDPDKFWGTVKEKMSAIPSHLHFHAVYPSQDMMRAVCLWDAENISAVDSYLAEAFGDLVRNEYYDVNAEAAVGLPKAESMA
jgi:hypothetical protein